MLCLFTGFSLSRHINMIIYAKNKPLFYRAGLLVSMNKVFVLRKELIALIWCVVNYIGARLIGYTKANGQSSGDQLNNVFMVNGWLAF